MTAMTQMTHDTLAPIAHWQAYHFIVGGLDCAILVGAGWAPLGSTFIVICPGQQHQGVVESVSLVSCVSSSAGCPGSNAQLCFYMCHACGFVWPCVIHKCRDGHQHVLFFESVSFVSFVSSSAVHGNNRRQLWNLCHACHLRHQQLYSCMWGSIKNANALACNHITHPFGDFVSSVSFVS